MSGKSELIIFEDIPPQVVVESAAFQDLHPSSALDDNSPKIDFLINGSNTDYLDLNDTLLSITCKVFNSDGTKIPANAVAGAVHPVPANYFMNALFKTITVKLNGNLIEGGDEYYAYKATIDNIFNFNSDAKRIQLLPAGYSDDKDERRKWIADSMELELTGALRIDFFNQPKYLIPGVNVEISLSKCTNNFPVFIPENTPKPEDHNYKISITSAVLYVRRVKVHPSVLMGHSIGLKKQNAIYRYTKSKVVNLGIPQGNSSYIKENIFSKSILPKFVVIGMVHGNAYDGSVTQDPFKFQPFQVTSVALYRNGQSLPYRRPYITDFYSAGNKKVHDAFVRSMICNTQMLNTNLNNGIELNDFKTGGYTLFTFNLTPDWDMNQVQTPKDANLRLEITFSRATTHAINVICYALYDTKLEITEAREIIGDAFI